MPDWEESGCCARIVKASFAYIWIFFWWLTPVMYVTVLAMVQTLPQIAP